MSFLRLLLCIVSTICPVYMDGKLDQRCVANCSCCVDKLCGPGLFFPNTCYRGCIDGHRGARCYELCQYKNCKSCGGNTLSHGCTECNDGYYPGEKKDCASPCPSNCKSCTSKTKCTQCKEGFYHEFEKTTCDYSYCPANCECKTGRFDCISCKKGFYDTSSLCNKQCPVNCLTCELEESCNNCKSGFYNGYEYDDNINLQLNNCSYACKDTCTQCQSYNTCLQCIKGKYGQRCEMDCSVGCKDRSCLFDSGHCECISDFIGDKCNECVDGKYGLFCNQTCSKYCKGDICKRTSGDCIDGCISENIGGNSCNTCITGMYGKLCNGICSKNCINSRCHRYSGNCSEGCIGNFNGTMCDLCIYGKYGEKCELDCPVNCAGRVCKKSSGTCYDCSGYFKGEKCDECMSGYYGLNCEGPCSQQCASGTCDRNTGECFNGCTNGYSGDSCCVKGEHCLECNNNTVCRKCEQGFFKNACNERCPKDCIGSCDISTGECSNCQYNRFGQFCEFYCSHRCKFEEDNHERKCTRSDATCINGCDEGYFGRTCNKTCSRFCIGGKCRQNNGVCINGCEGNQEEPECFLSEVQKDNEDYAGKTSAILGTLFAMSVIINIVQGVFMLLKKRREALLRKASRQQPDVTYENPMMCTAPPIVQINETNVASADNTTVYEAIDKVNEADEEYQTISNI